MGKKHDLPAMPFYIGDWKKDPAVQVLTLEEKMIWLEMIFLMWESSERGYLTINNKPITNQLLAVALNLDNQRLTTCLTHFEELGLFSRRKNDNAIYSRKIVNIVELSNKRKQAGKMGGNPKLVNQRLTDKLTNGKGGSKPNTENENENENENEDEDENINNNTPTNFDYIQADWWIERAKEDFKTVNKNKEKFALSVQELRLQDGLSEEQILRIQKYLEKPIYRDGTDFTWYYQIGTPKKLRIKSAKLEQKYWEIILREATQQDENQNFTKDGRPIVKTEPRESKRIILKK